MSQSELPRVLLVAHQSISLAHGTGAVLLRHFADYDPSKLANIYLDHYAEASIACRVLAKGLPPAPAVPLGWHGWPVRLINRGLRPMRFRLTRCGLPRYEPIRPQLESLGFRPDVIYGNCYGVHDLSLLLQLASEYGGDIPVIQHFHDYQRDGAGDFYRVVGKLLPYCDRIWALAEGMAEDLRERFRRPVEIMSTFKADVPPDFKRDHRPLDRAFRAVIVGNVYRPRVFDDIRQVWRFAQQQVPGLGPIRWIGHPAQVKRCAAAKVEYGPEVEYVGFVEKLHEELMRADAAIVPLNQDAIPQHDYERFSIPSRITEFALAGMPIFCIAGPGTETRRFVEHHGIGLCSNGSEGARFAEQFWNFLYSRDLRAQLGLQARRFGENDFDLKRYQHRLYGALQETAARGAGRGQSARVGWTSSLPKWRLRRISG